MMSFGQEDLTHCPLISLGHDDDDHDDGDDVDSHDGDYYFCIY